MRRHALSRTNHTAAKSATPNAFSAPSRASWKNIAETVNWRTGMRAAVRRRLSACRVIGH